MRPTQGPHNMGVGTNQRPQSKSNKLYYYQGYHDGSSKYKRKPPKGMYINHDDVVTLATQDRLSKKSPQKTPAVVSRKFDLLAETEHEISVLHGQVRLALYFSLLTNVFSSFFTSMFVSNFVAPQRFKQTSK
jgi:hypothetical protein